MKTDAFLIAQIGRTVGLRGDVKLHLHTDFPEQFTPGAVFQTGKGATLTVAAYNPVRGVIRFVGYDTVESAKKLTNTRLYATLEQTKETIELAEGEHFWFEIIGCRIVEEGEVLGVVEEIDRMLDVDYLSIVTDAARVAEGLPKSFLLPYIPRYILHADVENKRIETTGARDVLEAS
jgi:16S rRNA processing protein RimM